MPFHTALQQKNVPLRCTSSTLAKSATSILAKDLSRRIPALAHNRSTLPHSLVARSTIACTCSKLETSAPSAIATPPSFRISSTTASAGVSEPPVPSRPPPKSLTTTLAPRLASPSACARPRPLPAPVTLATRPSKLIVFCAFLDLVSLVMPGLDPGIHQINNKEVFDQRWIAGSSPAMTGPFKQNKSNRSNQPPERAFPRLRF